MNKIRMMFSQIRVYKEPNIYNEVIGEVIAEGIIGTDGTGYSDEAIIDGERCIDHGEEVVIDDKLYGVWRSSTGKYYIRTECLD